VREDVDVNSFIPVTLGITLLNLYALALILLRAPLYHTRVYRPMVWNIWLSISPALVLLAALVSLTFAEIIASLVLRWITLIFFGLVWLLMLPNGAYLITEMNFSHRREDENVPLWYDIVLVLTLALSGVVNTLANVFLAHLIFTAAVYPNEAAPMAQPLSWVIVVVLLALVAFGMYLGRYLRFNSWDLKNPARFVRKFREHFSGNSRVLSALGFTATHAILLGILYLLIAIPNVAILL